MLEELAEVRSKIASLEDLLSSEEKRKAIIREEMLDLSKRYGDKRRTKITYKQVKGRSVEDLIPREDDVLILSEGNLLKRVSLEEYRAQRRGGKGIITSTRREDSIKSIVSSSSHDDIFFFTNTGRVLKSKAYEIEKKSRKSVGVTASTYLPLSEGETIKQIMKSPENKKSDLVIMTRNGFIKKTSATNLFNMRASGLKIITLGEDDEVVAVESTIGGKNIVVISNQGKASVFKLSEVRSTGRSSRGVRAMRLKDADYVITGFIAEDDQEVLTISEFGIGKRTPLEEFSVHHRGSSGILVFKKSDRTGRLVKAIPVSADDDIIVVTKNEKTIRLKVSGIKSQSRVTSGVKLIDVEEGDWVIELSRVEGSDEQ